MEYLIPRRAENTVRAYLDEFPVVALVGPRQSGKSTLAQRILSTEEHSVHLDLELPSDRSRLQDPEAYLSLHENELVCLDEIQRQPELFPVLRALVDRNRRPGRFLVLGSASPQLLHQSSETLAGRIAYVNLTPFTLEEIGATNPTDSRQTMFRHWLRGGFPRSYLATDDAAASRWRQQFVRTFLEADIPALGIEVTRGAIERLWTMVGSATGTALNKTKLADPVGVSPQTVTRYVDILEATYMVRLLRPLYVNVKKRLVKAPKIYVRDTGILHTLLGIESADQLYGHYAFGQSWESYAVEQIVSSLTDWSAFYYRTSGGAEVDLVLERANRRVAVEIKASTTPRVSRGFYEAISDLDATESYVVAPLSSDEMYPVGRGILAGTPDQVATYIRLGKQ